MAAEYYIEQGPAWDFNVRPYLWGYYPRVHHPLTNGPTWAERQRRILSEPPAVAGTSHRGATNASRFRMGCIASSVGTYETDEPEYPATTRGMLCSLGRNGTDRNVYLAPVLDDTVASGWTEVTDLVHPNLGLELTTTGDGGFDGNPHPGRIACGWENAALASACWNGATLGEMGLPGDIVVRAPLDDSAAWIDFGGGSPMSQFIWPGIWWRWQGFRDQFIRVAITDPGEWGSGLLEWVQFSLYEYDSGTDTLGSLLFQGPAVSPYIDGDGWWPLSGSGSPAIGDEVMALMTCQMPNDYSLTSTLELRLPLSPAPPPCRMTDEAGIVRGAVFT